MDRALRKPPGLDYPRTNEPNRRVARRGLLRIKNALIAGSFLITGLVATAPAEAALSDCNANYMCAWGNNDFKWMLKERFHGYDTWSAFTGDANDETDSWANRSATYTGCLSEHADGGGDRLTMGRNSTDNNLAPWNSDQTSAMRTRGGC